MISPLFAALLDLSGTIITLIPSTDPEIIGTAVIENQGMNTSRETGVYPLSFDGITLEVAFIYNDGPFYEDRFTVIPPADVICEPADCSVLLLEGFKATITLKPYLGF
jgi:hypothetical protein